MFHYIFRFADGDQDRFFNSTFDANCTIVDAFNMCEEYFLGARLADEKEGWINILEAEKYVTEVAPVKSYLEHACGACFDDAQICGDVKRLYAIDQSKVLPSWRQHMEECRKNCERIARELETRITIGTIIVHFKS
ncbi:MAG: hypothetical protein J6S89_09400 [Paludibacteraceae bacterium]|nr:hypothetical protein [Paludibacteraceae bacterium]